MSIFALIYIFSFPFPGCLPWFSTILNHNFVSTDNAHALFVRATYLVCHRLISSWKTDLNVSLAALELLTGLARLHIKDSGEYLLKVERIDFSFEALTFLRPICDCKTSRLELKHTPFECKTF